MIAVGAGSGSHGVGAAAVLVAIVMIGCGSSSQGGDAQGESAARERSVATPVRTSEDLPRCERCVITGRDSGSRWTLSLGSTASIRLTNELLWSRPETSGDCVELVSVAYESDPGFTEWTVRPTHEGLSFIRFTGGPNPPSGGAVQTVVRFEFVVVD